MNDEAARDSEDPDGPRDGSTPAEADRSPDVDPPAVDIDLQFASIIAHWEDEAPQRPQDVVPPSRSAATDLSGTEPSGTELSVTLPAPHPSAGTQMPSGHDDDEEESLFGWRGYTPPADVDDHFEPPPPELPPVHDATYWLAVAGLTMGPLLIMWAAVFSNNPDPGWWVLFGIALTVAGFGLMVLRGSGERDPDDNGARV